MVKLIRKDIELKDNEYVIRAKDRDSLDYEVYYKGELLNDVTMLVRINV